MADIYELGRWLQPWGWLLSLVVAAVVAVFAWAIKGQLVTRGELAERDRAVAEAAKAHAQLHRSEEERTQKMAKMVDRHEQRIRDLPTNADLHELDIHITKLEGTIAALTERISGFGAIVERAEKMVDRQEAYLLRQGGRDS